MTEEINADDGKSMGRRRRLLGMGALLLTGAGFANKAQAIEADKVAAKLARSKPITRGYADVAGLRVYHEVHGRPLVAGQAPFVLLPGGATAIETAFADTLLPRLARVGSVIAIEPQGHGHTGDREGPVTLDRMVDDIAGVLAHLRVKQAHIIGHSLGGLMAMGMAVRHPDAVKSVTAISAIYQLEGWLPELVTLQRDPTHQPSPALVRLLPTEADFAKWQAHFKRVNPAPDSFERVLEKLNTMLARWPGWTPAELRAIRAPVLLPIGDNDFTRVEHAAEMARLIPDAQLAVLPGTTHLNILTRDTWLVPMIQARIGMRAAA